MNQEQEVALERLNKEEAVFLVRKYIVVDDIKFFKPLPDHATYKNSLEDRQKLAAELPEPYLSAVMAVWGDAPPVEPPEPPEPEAAE